MSKRVVDKESKSELSDALYEGLFYRFREFWKQLRNFEINSKNF